MTIENYIWDQIKAEFKKGIPMSEFETWLSRACLKTINTRQAVIEVPNKFIANWLQENYTDQIRRLLTDRLSSLPEVCFTYAEPTDPIKTQTHQDVKGIDVHLNFEGFITGNSNRLAWSSALSVAQRPGITYNPLYLYSQLSLGKTHLLHAIGNLILENDPQANILYLSTDRFLTDVSLTTDALHTDRFWEEEGCPDLLLLDDIHRIAHHSRPQTELLALCNAVLDSGRQLVATAISPPGKIQDIIPQLRSRLEWGLIAEIHPPCQKTKLQIIQQVTEKEQIRLPDDVAFFLAGSTDDIATLIHHMARIKRYLSTGSHSKPIDISTTESIIQSQGTLSSIDIQHIQHVTAEYFNIHLSDLLSGKRGRAFSYPRQAAIYLSKKWTPLSLKEIGRAFGNKHHSTILYAEKCIQQGRTHDEKISRDIDAIQKLLF